VTLDLLVAGVLIIATATPLGFIAAYVHARIINRNTPRPKFAPPKYSLVSCDCGATTECPQGRAPEQPRCKIWKQEK
jgi:hypothetical protein